MLVTSGVHTQGLQWICIATIYCQLPKVQMLPCSVLSCLNIFTLAFYEIPGFSANAQYNGGEENDSFGSTYTK